ncbi:hypothetical protein [Actinokineospora sp. NPDC004072]
MKPRLVAAAVSAAAVLAVAGACGSDPEAPPQLPAPGQGTTAEQAPPADLSDPAVAWAEKVCTAVEDGGKALSQFPAVDPSDPAKTKQAMLDYLQAISDTLAELGAGISAAGEPPVDGGAAAVDAALKRVEDLRAGLSGARAELAAVETGDPAAFQAALAALGPRLEGLNTTEGPTTDLKANPALKDAFAQAPACRRVDGV